MSDPPAAKITARLENSKKKVSTSTKEDADTQKEDHDGNEATEPSSHRDEERIAIMGALTKMQRGHNLLMQAAEKLEFVLGDTSREFPRAYSSNASPDNKKGSFDTISRNPSRRQTRKHTVRSHQALNIALPPEALSEHIDNDEANVEGETSPRPEEEDNEDVGDEPALDTVSNKRSFGGRRIQRRPSKPNLVDVERSLRNLLNMVLENTIFQCFSVSLILFTVVLICIDTNARAEGVVVAAWVDIWLLVCFIAYLFEFLATIFVQGAEAVESQWNYLDAFVITTSLIDYCITLAGVQGFSLLRLLRICRLLRLGRVVRALRKLQGVQALKEQYLLMTMMASCVRTVCWAFLVCMFVMTVWSILAVELLNDIVERLAETSTWSGCSRCHRSFSSIWDSNLTFMQTIVAGDSWGLIALPVIEDSWWSMFIFLGALSTIVFGILNMISVVVIDTFAERRSKDLTHVATELEFEEIQERKQLKKIFEKIDEDQSGELSLKELKEGAEKVKEFQQYLRVLDIDDNDLVDLFAMIDNDGSGEVDPKEFIDALYRMKSAESKTATRFVKHMVSNLFDKTKVLDERLDIIQSNVTSKIAEVEKQIRAEFEAKPYEQRFEHILEDHADEINNTVTSAIDKAVSAAFESVVASASRKASHAIQEVVLSSSTQVAAMSDRLGLAGLSCSRQVSTASNQAVSLADRANRQVSDMCSSPRSPRRKLYQESIPESRGLVHLGEYILPVVNENPLDATLLGA